MKYELKSYQEAAAAKVLADLRKGSNEYLAPGAEQAYTAVSLAAPTGSGKTVIAAAVIERMLFGDPNTDSAPDPDAVFVWLTDDPALNEQTRMKMLQSSELLQPGHLVTLDESFDQPRFTPGTVNFLNIQKLGAKTSFVVTADGKRKYTFWETITNTINDAGGNYYLVIDEAHRGTGNSAKARQTIVKTLIAGKDGVVPAAPVVWGISATPQRFDQFIQGTDRVPRKCEVPVSEVRESGLIKDVLALYYRAENQDMDLALVREAALTLKAMDKEWNAYTDAEGIQDVRPAMVLQLPPSASPQDVATILDVCAEAWPELAGPAVAHAMESHTAAEFGSHTVNYVAPQAVQDHPRIRLVLFKEALTTGWDCPRAEVMVSLRKAQDYTYIAQLIGRMVRSPLARRIEANEQLNRVALFLPGFAADAVNNVKRMLETDPEGPPTDIEIEPDEAWRNPKVPEALFGVFAGLPSYSTPSVIHRSQVARLHKLAGLLAGDDVLTNAVTAADAYLINAMNAKHQLLDSEGKLAHLIKDVETNTVAAEEWGIFDSTSNSTASEIDIVLYAGDLNRQFAASKRQFKDGLATTYWAHLVTSEGLDPQDAKVIVVAMSRDIPTVERAEKAAVSLVRQWQDTYGNDISSLTDDRQARYRDVRAMAKDPELIHPILPTEPISMPSNRDIPTYEQHLYSDKSGRYRTKLATWEEHCLATEQGRPGFVGWYRNPTGGQRCLRIPYKDGDTWKSVYPDLIVFHAQDDEPRPSIVDPHGHHLADAPAKLRGLAEYAAKHGDSYARIIAVIRDKDGNYRMLDLKDPTIQKHVPEATSQAKIENLFKKHGSSYQ